MAETVSERRKRYRLERRARDPEGYRAMRKAQKQRYRDRRRKPGRLKRGELAAMSNEERRAYLNSKRIQYKYSLTKAERSALLAAQGGVCAICGGVEDGKVLVVDHCHDTGRVRGLLCNYCNAGLGFFKDNPTSLQAAIRYLSCIIS